MSCVSPSYSPSFPTHSKADPTTHLPVACTDTVHLICVVNGHINCIACSVRVSSDRCEALCLPAEVGQALKLYKTKWLSEI